jgi:predicted dehydrogenase
MSHRNRREFLEDSMFAAAAAVAANSGSELFGYPTEGPSPGGKLGVAVVGARGRGGSHIGAFAGRKDTEILYVCDVDHGVGERRIREVAKRQGRQPQFEEDIRHVLDDPKVDVVSIATPNHLHAVQAIWSMQAGKDVYLEKPASHNISEGRRIVQAARKYQKICQVGTQCRSNPGTMAAIEHVRGGGIGTLNVARALCYKRRDSIGPRIISRPPQDVNYDLWLGPAPRCPVTRRHFHHDWHWQWTYGNGELGNQALHQLDIARWGLGVDRHSRRILSYGGRFNCKDAADSANTQVVVHDYGDQALVLEVRGLRSSSLRRAKVGVIFEGTDGYLVMHGYDKGAAFDLDGNKVCEFSGGGNHFDNFLRAVRSRAMTDLHADIEQGHLSSALCHLGNISYRLGRIVPTTQAELLVSSFGSAENTEETLARTLAHLQIHHANTDELKVGQLLSFDSDSESFPDHRLANAMLTRSYRAPFAVPQASDV